MLVNILYHTWSIWDWYVLGNPKMGYQNGNETWLGKLPMRNQLFTQTLGFSTVMNPGHHESPVFQKK